MLYSDFVKYCKHFIKISNTINDGWALKSYEDNVYLTKTTTEVIFHEEESPDELDLQSAVATSDIRKWEYHVVFSISFQVPVLYFNVYKSNGELLSLDELWSSVHPNFQNSVNKNKWYTLTQQEHPYLHRPFFYFHPCETSAFMDCFKSDCNKLITWLSSIGQIIRLELDESYGQLCSISD